MTYLQIVEYLIASTSKNSLNILKLAIDLLDLKIDSKKVIIVAGTNGKGSTSSTLSYLISATGKNVGFFSSPHLVKINERIKINNNDITDEEFCVAFEYVYSRISAVYQLSHFEYLTLIAAYYFFKIQKVDYAIFEVGLGGACDATNIIPHDTCVITKIALDHMEILGNSVVEIARDKFGIITNKDCKVFHSFFCDEVAKIISDYDAQFIEAYSGEMEVDTTNVEPAFYLCSKFGRAKLALQGRRALENTMLALTVFENMFGNTSKYLNSISNVNWPGRMEKIIYNNKDIFLSGDHNVDGIKSLIEILQYYSYKKIHIIVGICRDKKHEEMISILAALEGSHIYITQTPEKTLYISEYSEQSINLASYVSDDCFDVLDYVVQRVQPNELIIITGSLYLVGKIKSKCGDIKLSIKDT